MELIHFYSPSMVGLNKIEWEQFLIGLGYVRTNGPSLIKLEPCDIQPMTAPTGKIFTMRTKYV